MLTANGEYARDRAIRGVLDLAEEVSNIKAENCQLKAEFNQLKDENERLKGCGISSEGQTEPCGCEYCVPDENNFTRNLLVKTVKDDGEYIQWEVFIDPKYRMLRLTHGKFVANSIVIERCPMCGRKL